ncbi:MAG TPA: aminopeptidase P family protein [Bacteroidales bacterium]|nr:aminopeptidase P family protein [Bacteroidales bacterium]
MFNSEIYSTRRRKLRGNVKSGLGLFIGNVDSPINYPANCYHFRQDSDFLYFFGLDLPGLAAVIDFDSGEEWIFGDDFDIDDIVWMGPQPEVKELAAKCAINETYPLDKLQETIGMAIEKKRKIHFLPPYRGETKITLGALLNQNPCQLKELASEELIKAVIALRSIKEPIETDEIDKAIGIAYDMHVTAMKMCKPGIKEQQIFGVIEGLALAQGAGTSFPTILSINGQTLHNHVHNNILRNGRMMVTDAGAETELRYASDITRTTPVGGKFTSVQKDIYEVVLKANIETIKAARPGISYKDLHIYACRIITQGLKELGFMKGDVEEAVAAGAHALFMPHGIGHMLGLDVHDMEGLGENYVGYNDKVQRSDQFGMSFLRFALECKPYHVFTIEPGCYFIPQLIDRWEAEGKFREFINYDIVDKQRDFGGIRVEDNIVITDTGHRVLGKPIPKTVKEIEEVCSMTQ